MSDQPINNFKIVYSDEVGISPEQIEFVKQSEVEAGVEVGQHIYTMPKTFRFGPKTKSGNKTGLLVMTVGLFLFVGLVYVGYSVLNKKMIFSFRPPESKNNIVVSSTGNELITPVSPSQPSEVVIDLSDPEQAYLQLRLKLDNASTLEEYLNIFVSGASQIKAHQLAEQIIDLEAMSASQKSSTLSISKSMLTPIVSADQITKEINGNQATLLITKADTGRVALVKLLLEDNQWKFDDEYWQDAQSAIVTTTPEIVASSSTTTVAVVDDFSLDIDTDQDGLTDKEETVLGTNSDQADSDGDGYGDLAELRNGYNPAGSGKIINNTGLKSAQQGKWSILAPAIWISQLGSDDSAIFRAGDGQFIQLVSLSKLVGQDLNNWYEEIFIGQTADVTIVGNNQLAISPDGLTYYVARPALNYLISLTYNPESTKLLSYSNIFRLAADSLIINN
jgi:hypothetical protein